MRYATIISVALATIVSANPNPFNLRRTDGGDDSPSTCQEAVQSIPKCALSCIVQPPIDAGCKSAADFACTCEKKTNRQIAKAETPCVLKSCGLKGALSAAHAGKAVCELCNVQPEDPSDGHDGDGYGHGGDDDGHDGYGKGGDDGYGKGGDGYGKGGDDGYGKGGDGYDNGGDDYDHGSY
uniref:CFEM domain-containing protein n=1 Tax=Podosphaera xanthii TaxID=135283 RepID=A0A3S7MCP3_9PEZI|nr:CFEM domain-containing protein [Podosphaera xanthii]